MTQLGSRTAQFGFEIDDASTEHYRQREGMGIQRQIRAKALCLLQHRDVPCREQFGTRH